MIYITPITDEFIESQEEFLVHLQKTIAEAMRTPLIDGMNRSEYLSKHLTNTFKCNLILDIPKIAIQLLFPKKELLVIITFTSSKDSQQDINISLIKLKHD